jgi:hypothetical protein
VAEDAEQKAGVVAGRQFLAADGALERVEQAIMARKAVSIEDAGAHALLALNCLDRAHDLEPDEPLRVELTETARRLLFSIVDAIRAAGVLKVSDRLAAHMGARWRSPWLPSWEANSFWRADCFENEAEAQELIDRAYPGRGGPL